MPSCASDLRDFPFLTVFNSSSIVIGSLQHPEVCSFHISPNSSFAFHQSVCAPAVVSYGPRKCACFLSGPYSGAHSRPALWIIVRTALPFRDFRYWCNVGSSPVILSLSSVFQEHSTQLYAVEYHDFFLQLLQVASLFRLLGVSCQSLRHIIIAIFHVVFIAVPHSPYTLKYLFYFTFDVCVPPHDFVRVVLYMSATFLIVP